MSTQRFLMRTACAFRPCGVSRTLAAAPLSSLTWLEAARKRPNSRRNKRNLASARAVSKEKRTTEGRQQQQQVAAPSVNITLEDDNVFADDKAKPTRTVVYRMKKSELQQRLRQLQLNATGTRQELIPRLLETLSEQESISTGSGNSSVEESSVALETVATDSTFPTENETSREVTTKSDNETAPVSQSIPQKTNKSDSRPVASSNSEPYNLNETDMAFLDDNLLVDDTLTEILAEDKGWSEPPQTESRPSLPPSAQLEPVQHDAGASLLLEANRTYVLRTKGHSKVNSSGTGVGIVLYDSESDHQDVMVTARKYLTGDRSLALAEYTALVLGLRHACGLGARRIIFETDHDVLRKQIAGEYPVEKNSLKPLYWQVMKMRETVLESLTLRPVANVDDVLDLAKKALATGKSLNMNGDVIDPMGKDFAGQGQDREGKCGPVEADDNQQAVIDPSRTYTLQFDGGVRGNPSGISGCGMVLFDDQGTEVWCGWKFLPPMTNNMAEYNALLLGLLCAQSLGVSKLRIQGDSELVVKQVNKKYKVKDPKLKELWEPTVETLAQFEEADLSYFPRAQNKRADWLANHAMDTRASHGFEEEED